MAPCGVREDVGMVIMFLWLTGLSLFDIRYRKVPVWLLLLGGVSAVVLGIRHCMSGTGDPAGFFGGMAPGLVLLLLAACTRKAGWADGIALMLLGSIMGFRQCVLTTMLSLVMISVWSALLLILKRADRATRIPYIPFLTMGFALCVITGG